MSSDFDLEIKADTPSLTAEFTLKDGDGAHAGYKRTEFARLDVSRRETLFNLRESLRRLVDRDKQPAALAELGVAIAKDVLGDEIFDRLWKPQSQRTLRIQLPRPDQAEDSLAAALARVPWEIARPAPDQPTLAERYLLVRVVHEAAEPVSRPLELGEDEALRVLFVFGAARGSPPLAARRERRALRELFEKEIYPHRRVVADFLTHGVTRERLEAQIRERGGYHIVHWSGHGLRNMLELAEPTGAQDLISGPDLLARFAEAGGFIPGLFPQRATPALDHRLGRRPGHARSARGGLERGLDASAQQPRLRVEFDFAIAISAPSEAETCKWRVIRLRIIQFRRNYIGITNLLLRDTTCNRADFASSMKVIAYPQAPRNPTNNAFARSSRHDQPHLARIARRDSREPLPSFLYPSVQAENAAHVFE
jgi:hypothetical protein